MRCRTQTTRFQTLYKAGPRLISDSPARTAWTWGGITRSPPRFKVAGLQFNPQNGLGTRSPLSGCAWSRGTQNSRCYQINIKYLLRIEFCFIQPTVDEKILFSQNETHMHVYCHVTRHSQALSLGRGKNLGTRLSLSLILCSYFQLPLTTMTVDSTFRVLASTWCATYINSTDD